MWSIMNERGIEAVPGWTAADGQGKEQLAMVGANSSFFWFCLAYAVIALTYHAVRQGPGKGLQAERFCLAYLGMIHGE